MGDVKSFQERFKELKKKENEKDILIEDLIRYVEETSAELIDTKRNLQKEKEKAASMQNKEHDIAKMKFVSVLIDGDCMKFTDDLIRKGSQGGHEAARLLKIAVTEHMRQIEPVRSANIKVVIQVYANVKGLMKAYLDAQSSHLEEFIYGFNMEDRLCDFVDAGDGKECTDEKLKAHFEKNILDVHCSHIIFGGSPDNGYARLLGPYSNSGPYKKRITLLEGPPFARELADLAPNFRVKRLHDIFRAANFCSRRYSHSSLTPPRTPEKNYASIVKTVPVATAATVTAAGGFLPLGQGLPKIQTPISFKPSTTAAAAAATTTTPKIHKNKHGHRIDPSLNFSEPDIKLVKQSQPKFCNNFHIRGGCYDGDRCCYTHGERLSGKKLEALKFLARTNPCYWGLECVDPDCVMGHQCPSRYCDRSRCRFREEMHGVDTVVVAGSVVVRG